MPYYMYVALQADDKISVLTIDPHTGTLTPQGEVSVPGGPFTLAISPDRKFLYAGCRDTPQLSSFAINPANGGLTQNGAVSLEAWPVYIATDRKGKFVLSAYSNSNFDSQLVSSWDRSSRPWIMKSSR